MSNKSKAKGRGRSKRKAVDSWKEKQWYEIYAPKSFKDKFIGNIPGQDNTIIGRTVEILLSDLTRDFSHQHIKLRFKITGVTGNRCDTMFIGHELTRDFIRALIHRGSTRIDGIFNYKTADGFIYRVSAFCVTKRRAKGSQKYTIRKIIFDVLNEFAKSSNHGKFIRGMIYGKYAQNISKLAKTIYPLKECQIRKCKLISFPEGAVDEDYDEDEIFEEKSVKLKPHGKSIKAKQKARKSAQKQAAQAAYAQAQAYGNNSAQGNSSEPSESPETQSETETDKSNKKEPEVKETETKEEEQKETETKET